MDSSIPEVDEYVEVIPYEEESILDEPVEVAASPSVSADDELYWDNLKLIAKGVDNDVLDLMRRVHASTGTIVPLTVVRVGSKLLIRTNGDQPSFDEHYMAVQNEAEQIFEGATEVTATKNNVQVIF